MRVCLCDQFPAFVRQQVQYGGTRIISRPTPQFLAHFLVALGSYTRVPRFPSNLKRACLVGLGKDRDRLKSRKLPILILPFSSGLRFAVGSPSEQEPQRKSHHNDDDCPQNLRLTCCVVHHAPPMVLSSRWLPACLLASFSQLPELYPNSTIFVFPNERRNCRDKHAVPLLLDGVSGRAGAGCGHA